MEALTIAKEQALAAKEAAENALSAIESAIEELKLKEPTPKKDDIAEAHDGNPLVGILTMKKKKDEAGTPQKRGVYKGGKDGFYYVTPGNNKSYARGIVGPDQPDNSGFPGTIEWLNYTPPPSPSIE